MEADRETTSGGCTNIMDTDIDLEPGPCGSDKNVESKNQADSATEIPKTSGESMKVVQDKFENTSVGLHIGIPRSRISCSMRHRDYVTRGHIDFPSTLPKDGKNQIFQ